MDSSTRPRRRSSWPAVLGVGAVAIPLVAFVIAPRLAVSELSVNDAEALALTKGVVPARSHPPVGTTIFQWDPDLPNIPPFLLGAVTKPSVISKGEEYVLIQSAYRKRQFLALSVRPHGLRYWVKK